MRRQASRPQGFTLIEAAVAVGVIAILASTAAPLVLKALNQQREQRVRTEMKLAFEALFGSRERVLPNMRSDFGFTPPAGTSNLGGMMRRTAAPTPYPPVFGIHGGSVFQWGWNGPYWTGRTALVAGVQVPVDPWGNPYLIRIVTGGTPGYQILCTGRNGVSDTPISRPAPLLDDLVYPLTPVSTTNSRGNINVTVENRTAASLNVRVAVQWKNGATLSPSVPPASGVQEQTVPVESSRPFNFSNVPAGILQITVSYPAGATRTSYTHVYELIHGQTLPLQFNLQP